VKHGAKNSQMLMDTKNIVYKGKSLHVHRNNKNHISKDQNCKYTHCFLIHLNEFFIFLNIKNTQTYGLTPKRRRPISQKSFKTAISSSRSLNEKIYNFLHF
jgi:hypothetical protein